MEAQTRECLLSGHDEQSWKAFPFPLILLTDGKLMGELWLCNDTGKQFTVWCYFDGFRSKGPVSSNCLPFLLGVTFSIVESLFLTLVFFYHLFAFLHSYIVEQARKNLCSGKSWKFPFLKNSWAGKLMYGTDVCLGTT